MSRTSAKKKPASAVDPVDSLVTARVVEYGRHRGARRVRMEATTWVDAGIEIMVRQSIEKVGVENLAKKLGVTKGSFYWHFKSRADLLAAILDRWTRKATHEVAQRVDKQESNPGDRLMRLLELPFWSPRAEQAADLELAIRAWARRSPVALSAVQKVDEQRIEYLVGLFRALGFTPSEAAARAHLAYGFMRYLSLLRGASEAEERVMIRTAYSCLTTAH